MTKEKSHRKLLFTLIFDDGKSLVHAWTCCKISEKTGARWLEQYHLTGSNLSVRHRDSTDGKMPHDDQEALYSLIAINHTSDIDE